MRTIRESLEKELREAEIKVAQIRGKMARLERELPGFLELCAPRVRSHAGRHGISITLYDNEHTIPHLPTTLSNYALSKRTDKQVYGDDDDKMEYFSFYVSEGVHIDLDRKLHRMKKCRKARVQTVVDICGEPGDDVEVVEWIE